MYFNFITVFEKLQHRISVKGEAHTRFVYA